MKIAKQFLHQVFLTSSLLISIILIGCNSMEDKPMVDFNTTDYADVLDIQNSPSHVNDFSAFFFSDQGAWFGFALPDSNANVEASGFVGPFLLSQGTWVGPAFSAIELTETLPEGTTQNLLIDAQRTSTYLPGRLQTSLLSEKISLEQSLWFENHQIAIIHSSITNVSKNPINISLKWKGDTWLDDVSMVKTKSTILAHLKSSGDMLGIHIPKTTSARIHLDEDDKGYEIAYADEIILNPGEQREFPIVMSFTEGSRVVVQGKIMKKAQSLMLDSSTSRQANELRWNGYLNSILNSESPLLKDEAFKRVAVKSLETLITNWRAPRGSLEHGGLFPSASVWYFNGFWGWDSWKHAVALARFAPEIAEDQIVTMFDHQDQYGMIADCVYADSTEDNWRNTKPPLAAWAVKELYDIDDNLEFVKMIYPKLVKYHEWWYENRDHDQNGLCEYGCTDGTLEAAKWESGVDDGVHYDSAGVLKNNDQAWSMDQESVDLNAYLWFEKRYLAELAEALEKKEKAKQFRTEAAELKKQIQDLMFDEEAGYFFDIRVEDKSKIEVYGPQGWIPLWVGLASKDQAAAVRNHMLDPEKFATYVPFPTIAKNHPAFMTGYWRGPVWLDQAFFGVSALRRYGYVEDADNFTRQLIEHAEGLLNDTGPIRENYNPLTGEGMKVNHFSWSAAHLLMMQWQL